MANFKKTPIRALPKIGQKVTADTLYWRKLNFPVTVKEFGPIDYIDVMPVEPHFVAVSCSSRVQIYNPITHQVQKTFTRFKDAAYGASFRSDGKLLCSGTDEGSVKLFDVSSKSLLRIFKGHSSPVHRAKFTADNTHIISFSDDKGVSLWDIPSETQLCKFQEHNDYVRAGCVSSINSDIFLSGSYDHTVKLYDARSPEGSTMTVDHGAPVECVLMYPGNSIFVSVGGLELRVWDALAGGRLLARVSQHHKTIMCAQLATNGSRLITAGLDRHAKIYDIQTYRVVHTLDFPSPVLSLGITPDDFTVIAGMSNGLISMQHRQTEAEARALEPATSKKQLRREEIAYQFKIHADYNKLSYNPATDLEVAPQEQSKLPRYDMYLKKFQFTKALDTVLAPYISRKKPSVTVSVLQELMRRGGLASALAGREDKSLGLVLRFLARNINDPGFTSVLVEVANTLLDIYENSVLTAQNEKLFVQLQEHVVREAEYMKQLMQLEGMLHTILSSAGLQQNSTSDSIVTAITPSAAAISNSNVVLSVK